MLYPSQQADGKHIGWVGCVPVVANTDDDIVDMNHQYLHGDRSASMNKHASFDDFIRSCTAQSTEIILKMMNTVDAGEVPPRADVLCKQIQRSQIECKRMMQAVRENQDF